ncbi:MAG: polysaccharide deacetylase family protein [Candidatus Krumholzibacteriota bacterium]|nr:polysaccharide deacetylase family protein [Candidatus Krumholzibacteriota bacterium]
MKYQRTYSLFKSGFYIVCKALGIFRLSRVLTRSGLRILCYHGFEIEDESHLYPLTFMTAGIFDRRLRFLKENAFNVIPVQDALALLQKDELPPDSVVITIDDGFYSTFKIAAPMLKEYSFPAVVYVSTYYVLKQTPVFRLVIQYMFWKTTETNLDMSELLDAETGSVDISDINEKEKTILKLINYGENECDEEKRGNILRRLGELLNVSFDRIVQSRMLHMMNIRELRDIQMMGLSLELHTHRHRFPVEKNTALAEIEDNREALRSELNIEADHFCYPSGIWDSLQFPWLEDTGIKSAVTCDPGLNYPSTDKFALTRFLDGDNISNIEFEAELFGFSELMRKIKRTFSRQ